MNKKVDLTRLKKLRTVRVGHFSSKAPTKNYISSKKHKIELHLTVFQWTDNQNDLYTDT